MLIKIIKNGFESEWIKLTAELRDSILNDETEWVVVRVEDLYPGSPDKGKLIKLEKIVFCLVAKDFIQEQKRQKRGSERHLDNRELDSIREKQHSTVLNSPELKLLDNEIHNRIKLAKGKLTKTQRRRLHLHFDEGLSLREIATLEGVHNTSVEESIQAALKKIKKYF